MAIDVYLNIEGIKGESAPNCPTSPSTSHATSPLPSSPRPAPAGKTIPKAKFEFWRADGAGQRIKYFEIEMENVLISHVRLGLGHQPDRSVKSVALLALLSLPLLSNAAPPAAARPALTGDALVRQYLGEPGKRSEFPRGDAYVDRETARGYMDGVRDLTRGSQWCDPVGAPHEAHADVAQAIAKLPAARRAGAAAPLVAEALAQLYPCWPHGAKK